MSGVNSLLSRLHRPTSSELSRKRKVDQNPPPKGKKRSRGASASDPKSVTPSQRVKQYTGEAASQALLCQPSSAAAERVFSVMNSCFGDQQLSSLEDYLEASIIMQYNKVNNV